MKIILLGAPGSGKGTQGDMISEKYGFPRISTGDLLREEVAEKTPLGKIAKADINRGELVKDDLVLEMVDKRIHRDDCQGGCILDGFPRNISQARMLEAVNGAREVVIEIFLDDNIVINRLSARRICSGCGAIYNLLIKAPRHAGMCDDCEGKLIQRDDDKPGVIKDRLVLYHNRTEPLAEYYRTKGVFHRVIGNAAIESVFGGICRILDDVIEGMGN